MWVLCSSIHSPIRSLSYFIFIYIFFGLCLNFVGVLQMTLDIPSTYQFNKNSLNIRRFLDLNILSLKHDVIFVKKNLLLLFPFLIEIS